jgi:hypothetical protein
MSAFSLTSAMGSSARWTVDGPTTRANSSGRGRGEPFGSLWIVVDAVDLWSKRPKL